MTTYYVTTSGSDSNNGLTEGTAFATPGYAASQARTTGDVVYVKEGTYNFTTTSQNVSGGLLSIARGVRFEGYKTTPQDRLANPVLSFSLLTLSSSVYGVVLETGGFDSLEPLVVSLTVDGSNNSSLASGFSIGSAYNAGSYYCKAVNCYYGFIGTGNYGGATSCESSNCTFGFRDLRCLSCYASSCVDGFYVYSINGGDKSFIGCVSANNTAMGFYARNQSHIADSCTAYGNGSDGFFMYYDSQQLARCLSVSNSGYGFALTAGSNAGAEKLWYCADYNNASGRLKTGNTNYDFNPISLSSDPFVLASSGDFRLNNNAGGGEDLRHVQTTEIVGFNNCFDIGAIDAVVTAGGGGATVHPLRSN